MLIRTYFNLIATLLLISTANAESICKRWPRICATSAQDKKILDDLSFLIEQEVAMSFPDNLSSYDFFQHMTEFEMKKFSLHLIKEVNNFADKEDAVFMFKQWLGAAMQGVEDFSRLYYLNEFPVNLSKLNDKQWHTIFR